MKPHHKAMIKALLTRWQFYCILLLVATTYLFLKVTEPKQQVKVSKVDESDTISLLQGGDILKGDGK